MKSSHICRCHVCGFVNEVSEGRVESCKGCHKPVARYYYFDDRLTPVLSDLQLRPHYADFEIRPLHGLTAYWETF